VNRRLRDGRIARLGRRLAAIMLAVFGAMATGHAVAQDEGTVMPDKPIADVLQAHSEQLLSLPGVVGIGEGRCEEAPCVLVLVVEKTPALEDEIAGLLEGYPVSIVESGEILAREPE